jgi:multicomponent Na+:H+ antiporter subunit A
LLWAVFAGFIAAAVAPWLPSRRAHAWMWLVPAVPAGLFAWFASFIPRISGLQALDFRYPWIPGLGIGLDFRLDGLSLVFSLIITGIGALIFLYANRYFGHGTRLGAFHGLMLAFMGSMLGLVLSSNLIALYVFWELTSLFSFFLIGFEREQASARKAAWQALLVTNMGGLCLLAGFLLLSGMGGSLDIGVLAGRGETIRGHALYAPALILVLVGAFTKSAQFPFHFWLPDAMKAPTPVSAYLHSATMVKAGIYLLARLHPALGDTALWQNVLVACGGLTMSASAWLALSQTHLKSLLAYGTIWALGTLVVLLGIGTFHAMEVGVVLLVAHSLYKACLFMVAGILTHQTGEKDAEKLGGLRRDMPATFLAALAGAVSMAGLPPSIGFIAKELLLSVKGNPGPYRFVLLAIALGSAMAMFHIAAMVAFRPFFLARARLPGRVREADPLFLFSPLLLGFLGFFFGLISWPLSRQLLSPAVSVVLGRTEWVELSLWHGFNLALLLSLITLAGGITLFRFRVPIRMGLTAVPFRTLARFGPASVSIALSRGVMAVAAFQTHALQSGYLRAYLAVILSVILVGIGYALRAGGVDLPALAPMSIPWSDAALVLFMLAAALTTVVTASRMLAIAALGLVGFGMVLVFVLSGAPDLAMTQFLVEIATLLLLLLAFYHLPRLRAHSNPVSAAPSAALAVASGACVALVAYVVMGRPPSRWMADFFASRSLEEAHGRNIVNVILVDFRAFDTLGEITVLAVAAIAVTSLLRRTYAGTVANVSLVFRKAVRFIKPLMLVFSFFLLATGHHAPGGGFAGGLMAAAAYILLAMAEGVPQARRALPLHPKSLIGLGLTVSIASGLAGAPLGRPFLAGVWPPAVGLGSPLVFDAGVYLLVAGVTLAILFEFGEA